MGLNQAQMVGPRSEPQRQQKEKKDPLDQILQGLQIANGVLGIGVNYTTIQKHRAEQKALDDANAGVQTKDDQAKLQLGGAQEVALDAPGAQKYRFRDGPGDEGVKERAYILPPKEQKASPLHQVTVKGPDGGPLTKLVTEDDLKSGISTYREPKPPKEDKTNEITTGLRKEYDSHPVTKATSALAANFKKVEQAANNPDPSGATDVSLVYGYMKMLDPNSTVREGEFATAENSGGAFAKLGNVYNKVLNGERLSADQRQAFANESRGLMAAQLEAQAEQDERYGGLASKQKLSPDDVIDPAFKKMRAYLANTKQTPKTKQGFGEANAAPTGTTDHSLDDIDAELARRGVTKGGR